jgi:hypothetical protein
MNSIWHVAFEPNQPKYNSIFLFSCHELDSWLESCTWVYRCFFYLKKKVKLKVIYIYVTPEVWMGHKRIQLRLDTREIEK